MGGMTNLADLLRLLHNLIRLGTIAEVDPAAARVRVQSGENLTDWRPWLSARAGDSSEWSPPSVGEQVLLLSPSGDLAQAIVLTGIYSDANPAPADSADLWCRTFPDGTHIQYDHSSRALSIDAAGDVALTAAGTVTVDAAKVQHNGGQGVVTGAHICHFTGTPHGDCSSTVTAGK